VRHRFAKYQGLGNDFLVVEQAGFPPVSGALARQLCCRHFGIGADGVLLTGSEQGRPFMRVVNADGSTPEMCGNGLRCVALYLVERELMRELAFEVATDAGPHHVRVSRSAAGAIVEVSMRPPSLVASEVLRDGSGRSVDQPFAVEGRELRLTAVSMGNPHVVSFDDLRGQEQWLGPRIEKDPRFKSGANVGFARLRGENELDLVVWERGVGFTLACGTGACAAAVAAVETGRVARGAPVVVHLPGGPLTIRVAADGEPISMTGPAAHVFDGELELP